MENKSVSLDEEAMSLLLDELPRLKTVSDEGGIGEYLTIHVADGTSTLERLDPEAVATAILNVLSQRRLLAILPAVSLTGSW